MNRIARFDALIRAAFALELDSSALVDQLADDGHDYPGEVADDIVRTLREMAAELAGPPRPKAVRNA